MIECDPGSSFEGSKERLFDSVNRKVFDDRWFVYWFCPCSNHV